MTSFFKARLAFAIFGLTILAGCSQSDSSEADVDSKSKTDVAEFGSAKFGTATWE